MTMKNLAASCLAIGLILLIVAAIYAQEPAAAPKPGPEHEKLGYYVGKWTEEGEIKPSAFGPGGKYTATETCEWLQGKFAILCKEDGTMMGGEMHGTSIMSYNTQEKSYVYFETNNWGELSYYHGSVDGDTWTWNNEFTVNGQQIKGHFTLKRVSDDVANFSFEMAMGGQPYALVMTGKQTRQK